MTLALLCISLLLALFLVKLKRNTAATVLLAIILFSSVLVGQGHVPQLLLSRLQSGGPLNTINWKSKNLIIVLGAGTVKWQNDPKVATQTFGYSRLYETARLYTACKKEAKECYILASGGDPLKNGIPEAEVLKQELIEVGFPAEHIKTESRSNNTFQNAQFTSQLLKNQFYDQTILVTSGPHLPRALLYFQHFNINALGAPSDYLTPIDSLLPLAHNFTFNDIALHEYAGFWRYKLYNLMGWNAASSKPGTP